MAYRLSDYPDLFTKRSVAKQEIYVKCFKCFKCFKRLFENRKNGRREKKDYIYIIIYI